MKRMKLISVVLQTMQSLIWSDFLLIPASSRYDSSVSSNTISIHIIRFKCLFQGFFLTFFSHILKDEALVKNPRILQVFLISSYKEKEDTNSMRSTSFLISQILVSHVVPAAR